MCIRLGRLQFSLRHLLIFTAVVAAVMGYLATVLRRHETTQRIKQCVEKFSGTVTFDTDISDLDSAEAEKEDLGTPFERSIFGKGLTRRIIGINLYHGIPSPADMALFGEAKGLRFLNLCGINVDTKHLRLFMGSSIWRSSISMVPKSPIREPCISSVFHGYARFVFHKPKFPILRYRCSDLLITLKWSCLTTPR